MPISVPPRLLNSKSKTVGTNPSPSSCRSLTVGGTSMRCSGDMAGPTPPHSAVVAHAAAFLADLIANPLLRQHLLSAAAAVDGGGGGQHSAVTFQAPSIILDALDTAPSASPLPSSLRATERLLQTLPAATLLSCLLLALASAARRPGGALAAAATVLDLFAARPLPVMRHFATRRASAAAAVACTARGEEDRSVEIAALSAMWVLSHMSGAQAQKMRGLEREYELVLDVNCKVYALYLKKILEAGDAATRRSPSSPPPELVFTAARCGEQSIDDEEATADTDEEAISSQNGIWENLMWAEAEGDLYPRQGSGKGRRELMRPPSLYPQRVPSLYPPLP